MLRNVNNLYGNIAKDIATNAAINDVIKTLDKI